LPLPCARPRRTTKTFPLPCAIERRTANIYVYRAFPSGARQTYTFAVRFPTAHGKLFFKKMVFVLLFISPLQKYYFVLYISILYMSQLIYYI
jgi:hypothetical protein